MSTSISASILGAASIVILAACSAGDDSFDDAAACEASMNTARAVQDAQIELAKIAPVEDSVKSLDTIEGLANELVTISEQTSDDSLAATIGAHADALIEWTAAVRLDLELGDFEHSLSTEEPLRAALMTHAEACAAV